MRQRLVLRREEPTGTTAPITCPRYARGPFARIPGAARDSSSALGITGRRSVPASPPQCWHAAWWREVKALLTLTRLRVIKPGL